MLLLASNLPKWTAAIRQKPIVANVIVALLYIAIAGAGWNLAELYKGISLIWPASGLAFAAVFVGGWRILPGIAIGVAVMCLFIGYGLPESLIIAFGHTFEAVIALLLLEMIRPYSQNLRGYLLPVWLLPASIIAPITGATAAAIAVCFIAETPHQSVFDEVWLLVWSAHLLGCLVVTPVILTFKRFKLSPALAVKAVAFALIYAAAYFLIFHVGEGAPFLFAIFPVLLLARIWFGPAGSSGLILIFVVSILATSALRHSLPQDCDFYQRLLLFNTFVTSLTATSLILSAIYIKGRFRIPATILIVGWILSGWLYYTLRTHMVEAERRNFQSLVQDSERRISNRFEKYVDALQASASFYANSKPVSQDQWRNFVSYLDIQSRYPGIHGLGIILPVKPAKLTEFISSRQAMGATDFAVSAVPNAISPLTDSENSEEFEHFVITLLEPLPLNRGALGLDAATEAHRRAALIQSRDKGIPVVSERIHLVQDGQNRPGFVLFFPMFAPEARTDNVEARRSTLIGWSYAPFVTDLFFRGITGDRGDQVNVAAYDGKEIRSDRLVHANVPINGMINRTANDFHYVSQLTLGCQTFTFGWAPGPNFESQRPYVAVLTAASLAMGTCLLAAFVASLQMINRRDFPEREQNSIQD